jgi:hypothetical protein
MASLMAPFRVPRRKGIIMDGWPWSQGTFLFVIWQKRKWIGNFLML